MSKGQKRSNREVKKPKQNKPKSAALNLVGATASKAMGVANGKRK